MSTKEKILHCANRIITEKGLDSFTLEMIAKEANISKGGLLYHFPSKDVLIQEMINDILKKFISNMDKRVNYTNDDLLKEWLFAFVTARFEKDKIDPGFSAGLLAAKTQNRELVSSVVNQYSLWQEKLEKANDPVLSTIVRLATDGLVMAELFLGTEILSDEMREKVYCRLLELAKQSA